MHSHVRIKCESVVLDVSTQRHDLTVVRHSHVRDNIHRCQAHRMRIQHGKYYFLSFLWQDYAVGLNVMCSKQCQSNQCEFTQNSDVTKSAEILQNAQYFFSGSRGNLTPVKLWVQHVLTIQLITLLWSYRISIFSRRRLTAAPTSKLMHSQPSITMSTYQTSILQLGTMHGYHKIDLIVLELCWHTPGIADYISKVKCMYEYFVASVNKCVITLELRTCWSILQSFMQLQQVFLPQSSNVQADMAAPRVAPLSPDLAEQLHHFVAYLRP